MNARILRVSKSFALLLAAAVLVAACQPAAVSAPIPPTALPVVPSPTVAKITPAVQVSDQSADGGNLVVAEVDSAGPGWIVIHADAAGKPGPVLGYTAVKEGVNKNVAVSIDDSEATPLLFAMLHVDAGTVGTYEFPGADAPAMLDGQMVSPSFNVTGITAKSGDSTSGKDDTGYGDDMYGKESTPAASASGGFTLMVAKDATLGNFLVDGKGMTLYLFTKDTPGVSNCSGGCLQAWPALLVSGDPTVDKGVTGKVGTIVRDDGSHQVTYNDLPLYYYATDLKPGDITGQGVGGVWFVVAP